MNSKITATSIGLVLAASLLATGCDEKKETPTPDKTPAAKTDAKSTVKPAAAKTDGKAAGRDADKANVAAKDAPAASGTAASKDGKAGSCGKGSCGKGSCG